MLLPAGVLSVGWVKGHYPCNAFNYALKVYLSENKNQNQNQTLELSIVLSIGHKYIHVYSKQQNTLQQGCKCEIKVISYVVKKSSAIFLIMYSYMNIDIITSMQRTGT